MKPRVVFIIVMSVVVVGTVIAYQALKSSKSQNLDQTTSSSNLYNAPANNSNNSSNQDFSNNSSSSPDTSTPTATLPNKEEANTQGTRRPIQYIHICDTSDNIEYVSQGTPKCLGSDAFQSDYPTNVAGTVFSSPCKTTSSPTRYVYISNDEACPSGTTLLFYNSLGGSTSGPSQTN